MGKIFGICGDYKVDGKWRNRNGKGISFNGWFVLNDDDTFIGLCVEASNDEKTTTSKKNDDKPNPRVLVGSLKKRPDGHDFGIVFYMMSNNPSVSPTRYIIPDLGSEHPDEKGYYEWATFNGFEKHGDARISIQQYSRESVVSEMFLRKQLNQLRNINGNKKYVEEVLCS